MIRVSFRLQNVLSCVAFHDMVPDQGDLYYYGCPEGPIYLS